MPPSALERLNLGEYRSKEHDIRFAPTKYGRAYSEDLFMIHHHLEKNYRGFCNRPHLSKSENKSTKQGWLEEINGVPKEAKVISKIKDMLVIRTMYLSH